MQSQEATTSRYPEPYQSSPHSPAPIPLLKDQFVYYSTTSIIRNKGIGPDFG
jgi:hypothetical protein